jgi:hypothetical protein
MTAAYLGPFQYLQTLFRGRGNGLLEFSRRDVKPGLGYETFCPGFQSPDDLGEQF